MGDDRHVINSSRWTGAGTQTTAVRATLVEHQGTVSMALTLIDVGWRLLDEHTAPPSS